MDLTEINHSYEPYTEGSVVKRNFIFGIGQFVTGLGLLVSGLGLSLNAQAAAITIDAVTITSTPTTQDLMIASVDFSAPNTKFELAQDPVVRLISATEIQIDLYFVPPPPPAQSASGLARQQTALTTSITTTGQGTYSLTAGLDTLLAADTYNVTATSYFQNSTTFANTDMTISAVPIPAAIWLLLSGIAPLLMIGRRKFRA